MSDWQITKGCGGEFRIVPRPRSLFVTLIVRAANEWTVQTRAAEAAEVAGVIAECDGLLAELHDSPTHTRPGPARRAAAKVRDLVAKRLLFTSHAGTRDMLEAFGFEIREPA